MTRARETQEIYEYSEQPWDDETDASEGTSDSDLVGDGPQSGPYGVERSCTDVHGLLLFLFILAGFGWFVSPVVFGSSSRVEGSLRFHLDSAFLCQSDKTFWCRNASGGLMLQVDLDKAPHGAEVPLRWKTQHVCLERCPNSSALVPGCGGHGTGTSAEGYDSEVILDAICRPTEDYEDLREQFDAWESEQEEALIWATMSRHKWLLGSVCTISIGVTLVYLMFLYLNLEAVISLGLLALTVIPLGVGLWFGGLLCILPFVCTVLPVPPDDFDPDPLAFLLLFVGMIFMGVMCFKREQIQRVVACLGAAFNCVEQVRILIVHPILVATMYAFVTVAHVAAFAVKLAIIESRGAHLLRDAVDILLWASWLFHTQIVFFYSEVALNCIAATWCLNGGIQEKMKGYVRGRDILRAYWIPLRYHMGTVFIAAVVVGLLRPLQLTLGSLLHVLTFRTSPFSRLADSCFGPCLDAWNRGVKPFTKTACIEVALSGRSFCRAARRVDRTLSSGDSALPLLNGATRLLQALLVGLNVGACWVFVAAHGHASRWGETQFVLMGNLGILFAATLSLPFALLFDTVSDAILYCLQVEQERARRRKLSEERVAVPCFRGMDALGGWLADWSPLGSDYSSAAAEAPPATPTSPTSPRSVRAESTGSSRGSPRKREAEPP